MVELLVLVGDTILVAVAARLLLGEMELFLDRLPYRAMVVMVLHLQFLAHP